MRRPADRFFAPVLVVSLLLGMAVPGWAQPSYVLLDPPSYVARLSMDLKGARPTSEDLETSEGDVPALIDVYMETPEFERRMFWLANDIFLTSTSFVEYFMESYDYEEEESRWDVAKSVGDEPLRLFTYIVTNDLPLTELVTADYTVADGTLGWFWDIDYPGDYYGAEWLKARYLDGREHAGVLSQNGFYYRYGSTASNKQRHRANNITRIFLDDDHLLRDVSLDVRLEANDPELDLLDATRNNPACVACHSSMDGIGAHLFGFSSGPEGSRLYARETFGTFSAQGVQRAQSLVRFEPSYYGYPSRGFHDLGAYIAEDPRFARTMAKHIYRFLLHRDLDYRDRDLLNSYTALFKELGFNTKALIKAMVQSEEYRAVGVAGGTESKATIKEPRARRDFTKPWRELKERIAASKIHAGSKTEWLDMARLHAIQTGVAMRAASAKTLDANPSTKGTSTSVDPLPPEELIQPFKLATPEQLHSLGKALVGEVWNGYEAGQWMPDPFPHLEYNTDVKVAAGGYDGGQILERRWSVPPTYLLVLERWAEVLAEDVLERELGESVPWSARTVFNIATGKEDLYEAEPTVRAQIADWFARFYGESVDPSGPEVDDVFGVLLLAREEATEEFGDWYSVQVAWSHVLGTLLSSPKIALY